MDGNDPECAWHRGDDDGTLQTFKNIAKGTEKSVPLSAELSLLDDYFTIQKYRYGGTISLEYRIDDEAALSCLIPRFTLHSRSWKILSFMALSQREHRNDHYSHFPENDAILQIDITDDGVGMTEEQARQLLSENKNEKTEFFREIGISNVHKRLLV